MQSYEINFYIVYFIALSFSTFPNYYIYHIEKKWRYFVFNICNYIALVLADFRRIKRNTLFPAARFCRQRSDKAVKSGGGRLLRYPPS